MAISHGASHQHFQRLRSGVPGPSEGPITWLNGVADIQGHCDEGCAVQVLYCVGCIFHASLFLTNAHCIAPKVVGARIFLEVGVKEEHGRKHAKQTKHVVS